jgi:hypothetical protein
MFPWMNGAGWTFGLNDTDLLGLATTICYAIAAVLSFRAYRRVRILGGRRAGFWLLLGAFLLLLGFNKQLDLQVLLVKTAAHFASKLGWYGQRHAIRLLAVAVAGAAVLAVGLWLFGRWRSRLPRDPFLWTGLAVIAVFVFVRTKILDSAFEAVGFRLDRNPPAHFFELGGLLVLLWGLVRANRASGKIRPGPRDPA